MIAELTYQCCDAIKVKNASKRGSALAGEIVRRTYGNQRLGNRVIS